MDHEEYGEVKHVELKPGGVEEEVTEKNKAEVMPSRIKKRQ